MVDMSIRKKLTASKLAVATAGGIIIITIGFFAIAYMYLMYVIGSKLTIADTAVVAMPLFVIVAAMCMVAIALSVYVIAIKMK